MGCCWSSEPSEDEDAAVGDNLNVNMLRERKGDVFYKYEVVKTIGTGSMGDISLARIKDDKKGGSAYSQRGSTFSLFRKQSNVPSTKSERQNMFALKTIQLNRISEEFIEELRNEIDILRACDHPNIVKAYEVFTKRSQIYIVMELCSGGDLYRRLPYTEKESAKITGNLLSAIKYLHDKNVVHRDLKFENIMFESDREDAEIKLIDFGLSKKFMPGDRYMTEGVGTIYTMAPQVLQGVYTSQADLWSVGVVTYMLLSSQKPFYHKRRKRVIDKIMRCSYDFRGVAWDKISPEAKDFVSSLLVMDPKKRLNATEALKHEWLHRDFSLSDRRPSINTMKGVENNLLVYKDTSELKKVALNVIAHKSTTEEIMQMRRAFDQYDSSNDGVITFDEFTAALKENNYTEEEIAEIFESLDVNQNGVIMYTEFLAATLEVRGFIEEERIAEAFDRIDADDDGYISPDNLKKLLGRDVSSGRINKLIKEADVDGDGRLSFEEFLTIFRKDHHKRTEDLAHSLAELPLSSSRPESTMSEDLLGVDAKIPGGKYDSSFNRAAGRT